MSALALRQDNAQNAVLQLRRQFLEQWIEAAIELLDELDGDCDLEEGGDMDPSIFSLPRLTIDRVLYDIEEDTNSEPTGDEFDYSNGRLAGGC